jgi:hypothetical protein
MRSTRGTYLMPTSHAISILLPEFREAEAVKFIGTCIYIFICMDSTERSCHICTRRDRYAIRKCEWTQCEPTERN